LLKEPAVCSKVFTFESQNDCVTFEKPKLLCHF
jgi:hypothetical protein